MVVIRCRFENCAPVYVATGRVYVERYDELTDSAAIREIEIAAHLKAWRPPVLPKAPLCRNDKYGWNDDANVHPKIRGKVILKAMIDIGRKAYSCCFLKIMIRPMIAAITESIKEKLTHVAIYSFENPAGIPPYPISSYTGSQASVIKAVFHRT